MLQGFADELAPPDNPPPPTQQTPTYAPPLTGLTASNRTTTTSGSKPERLSPPTPTSLSNASPTFCTTWLTYAMTPNLRLESTIIHIPQISLQRTRHQTKRHTIHLHPSRPTTNPPSYHHQPYLIPTLTPQPSPLTSLQIRTKIHKCLRLHNLHSLLTGRPMRHPYPCRCQHHHT